MAAPFTHVNAVEAMMTFRRRTGFTLIELLVALAIMGVATGIFISLFNSSLDIAKSSANRRIAASLAEEVLTQMVHEPGRYLWDIKTPGADEKFAIKLGEDDPPAGNAFVSPSALPLDPDAYEKEQRRYTDFRWHAFGELRHAAAHYVVTVVVDWEESGREQKLALTSIAPRGSVDAARIARAVEQEAAAPATSETPAPDAPEEPSDSPAEEGTEAPAEDAA